MKEFKAQGTSMIIVAHGGPIMEQFCERILYLKAGHLTFDGPFAEGMAAYQAEP
jgi:ABC-type polysaccharide/polyol phosphate transport system ATPase subunit